MYQELCARGSIPLGRLNTERSPQLWHCTALNAKHVHRDPKQRLQLVCFDVDSTFCTDESIDELAAFIGKGEEVAALTRRAMGGSMKFQDALKARLDCMNVSEQDLEAFKKEHPAELSPGELLTSVSCVDSTPATRHYSNPFDGVISTPTQECRM